MANKLATLLYLGKTFLINCLTKLREENCIKSRSNVWLYCCIQEVQWIIISIWLKLGELGDYNSEEHADGYVSEYRFVPNQVLICVCVYMSVNKYLWILWHWQLICCVMFHW